MPHDIEGKLRGDLVDLFALLRGRGVSYLLVGGIAMLAYVEGRSTKDVDLLLSVDALEQVPEITLSGRDQDFARGVFGSLRVDVLLTSNPLLQLVEERHSAIIKFLEADARCATVEGLVLLKLYALPASYRRGDGARIGLDQNDIFMLCDPHRPNLEPLIEAIAAQVDEGVLLELRNIVGDIQSRIDRVDRARQTNPGP